jgi:hydrogenase-4 membrane subunit HyfE
MTSLLASYMLVLLLPLFVASWRVSLAGLSLQGLLMAWMVVVRHESLSAELVVPLIDLALVRGFLAPLALRRVLRVQQRPSREDVIPPNLLSWAMVVGLVMLAFQCAAWVQPAGEHTHVAVAVTGVLLGLFVLATQNGTFSQAVGALRLENAIALFELGSPSHLPIGLRVGQVAVFLGTVLTYAHFVRRLRPSTPDVVSGRLL